MYESQCFMYLWPDVECVCVETLRWPLNDKAKYRIREKKNNNIDERMNDRYVNCTCWRRGSVFGLEYFRKHTKKRVYKQTAARKKLAQINLFNNNKRIDQNKKINRRRLFVIWFEWQRTHHSKLNKLAFHWNRGAYRRENRIQIKCDIIKCRGR